MPLQTQGFQLSALPQPLQVPGNLGVVKPPLDPQEILALAQQHLSALNQAQQARVQNEQVDMAQRAQASSLASQAQQRSLSEAAGQREAAIFPESLSAAQLQNQGKAQTISQLGESFNTAAPVRSLAGAEAARNESLLGPEGETSDYRAAPDGNGFILTKTQTKNGIPVSKSESRVAFPPGYNAAMVGFTKGPVLYDKNGGPVATLQNRMGHVIRADSGDPINPDEFTAIAPSKAQVAASILTSKAEAQKEQDFPSAKEKVASADLALQDSQRAIKQALDLLDKYPNLVTKYAQNVLIKGTPASQFNALLQPIKSAQFLGTLNGLRGTAGNTGIGRVLQSEVPFFVDRAASIDPVLNPTTLAENLRYLAERAPRLRELARDAFSEHYATQLSKDGSTQSSQFAPRQAQGSTPTFAGKPVQVVPNAQAAQDVPPGQPYHIQGDDTVYSN